YYHSFLKTFPNVYALAKARWPSLLKVWRGLGYYQRARNLLSAARVVVSDFDGELPREKSAWEQLPGVGPYTASAIMSFAFGAREPAIDTNINRIFQRVFGCPTSQVPSRAEAVYALRPRSSRKLNYALMDFGALVCTARSPKCGECPLRSFCHFYSMEKVEAPARAQARGKTRDKSSIDVAIGCIHREGRYLLGKRKRRKGGNWEFPGGKREGRESIRAALKREVLEELGVEVSVRPPFHIEEFSDSSFHWRLHFCRCQILHGKERALEHEKLSWVSKEKLARYNMPSMNDGAVARLQNFRS
ncbi:MAG: NUDIX domain-containing protein, partial [Bdellovibrionales bacterium]|nr:NUDIX domain-containing protein [Bdellovibrionales bacterium]